MTKVMRRRAIKFLSPLMITAIILSSLVVFPSSSSALTASLALDGVDSTYLLGEWITFIGSVDFADGEIADLDSIDFVVDGPEPLNQSLPVTEGTHYLSDNLIVTVTWNNVTGESYGYGYGYGFEGGAGGGSIDYIIEWRPPYLLTDPDAELPETDHAWEVPDVTGLTAGKTPQGITSSGTSLYLLVDGTTNDIIIKTDLAGNVLGFFNAPNNNCRAITYLNGNLYVYADNYQMTIPVTDETPEWDEGWGKYKLPTIWDSMNRELVSGSLVVTADGEIVNTININTWEGSFNIDWGEVWDDEVVRGPSVVNVNGTYHMWYYSDGGLGGDEQIGHATSADGVNWDKDNDNNPVLSGDTGEWDSAGVLNPSVLYDSGTGTYHMWYIGHNASAVYQVGYATSTDGVNWTKHAGNPVLSPGTGDAWDSESIWDISVISGSSYEMWYTATSIYDNEPKIGYAYSTDGVTWEGLDINEVEILDDISDVTDPSWSPDGSQLACIIDDDLWVIAADGSSGTNITGSWQMNITAETEIDDQDASFTSWTGIWDTENDGNFWGGTAQYSNNPPSPIVTPESDASFNFTGDWFLEGDGSATGGQIKYVNDLPAPIVTQEDGFSYTGAWAQVNDGQANGGHYYQLPDTGYTGGSVVINFTGTEVALRYITDWNGGKVGVDIDGNPYDDIDMYGGWNFTSTTIADDLSAGAHVMTITQKDETTGGGYALRIDGIEQPNPTANSVAITFTGTEVALKYRQNNDCGIVSVDIDGTSYPNIDMYNPNWNHTTFTIADDLSDAQHVLTLTQLETKHALSSGYKIFIDGIEQPNPTENSATVTFDGTGVALRHKADWDLGKVDVTIDGTPYTAIDMYSSNWQVKETLITDSLTDGSHTLVITQRDDKNNNSNGYGVYIDGVRVYSPATLNDDVEANPAWHPSEARVAFDADITGTTNIFEADVTSLVSPVFTQVTTGDDPSRQPTWAPGGDMIAYSSNRDSWNNSYNIWRVDYNSGWGSPNSMLTDDWMAMSNPDWSPNGDHIVFTGDSDLHVASVDGQGQASGWNNITNSMATEDHSSWCPESSHIAYTSNASGDKEIWKLTYNQGQPSDSINSASQVTGTSGSTDQQPDWSPDGNWIAFSTNRSGSNYDLWKVENAPTNPVLSPSSTGGWGWDVNGLYSPSVIKDGATYRMWYAGQNENSTKAIGYATSPDGKAWTPSGSNPVLNTQGQMDNNWEDQHVYDPCVIKDGNYHMWYAGENNNGEVAIGKALSSSGSSWNKNNNNPLLSGGMGGATLLASYSYREGEARNSIITLDPTDGSYVNHYASPGGGGWGEQVGGLANDGTNLYACSNQWNEMWQIEPSGGSVNNSKYLGYGGMGGWNALEYTDGYLYAASGGMIEVYQWDSGNTENTYDTALSSINGLRLIGDTFYIGAHNVGQVYTSSIPGTVEHSSIGNYEAWIDADGTSSDATAFTLEKLTEPVDVVITNPQDGDASQTPQIDIDGTVNDPSIDYVQVGIALPSTDLIDDDMEDGDSATGNGDFQKQGVNGQGWAQYSPDNLWHLSDERSYSGQYSWAYNKMNDYGYNTPGQANAGAIVSEPFNIGEDCELRFWTAWDTDSWPESDRKLIDIYYDGSWHPLAYIADGDWYPDFFGGSRQLLIIPMSWQWFGGFGPGGGFDPGFNWYEAAVDLSGYAGESDVKIRFRFDTMDEWMNDFEGWYIDDVTVTGAGFAGISVPVTDLQFSTSYTLAEGYNDITVSAQSAYIEGDDGQDSETITVSLDTTGPIVTLHPQPQSTSQGSVEVSGTIFELNFASLVVTNNGFTYSEIYSIPEGGEAPEWDFSATVPLFEGENVIVATGTDAAGLTGSDTITIVRDSTPPTISVLPTVYFLGENAARTGDLAILQLDAIDESPAGTTFQPSGVEAVLLQTPGGEGEEWDYFIPEGMLPEAIIDQWGTTGSFLYPITTPDDAPPGTYNFTVKAIDRAGNESTDTVTATVVSTLSAYNIYLMPEFNFISLPLIPNDDDIETLLGSVTGVESVWYYDAATVAWHVYNTDGSPSDLLTMDTGMGYWVLMDETAFTYSAPLDVGLPETPAPIKFSYEGVVLLPATVPPTYQVEAGWNAIGIHSERAKDVSLYLRPVTVPQQVWASLLQYDNYISFELGGEEEEGMAEIYLGSFRTLLETDEMVPGKGFWLYLVQSGNLVAQP